MKTLLLIIYPSFLYRPLCRLIRTWRFRSLAHGFWCLVQDFWCLVQHFWCLVHVFLCLVQDFWCLAFSELGIWFLVFGVFSSWYVVLGYLVISVLDTRFLLLRTMFWILGVSRAWYMVIGACSFRCLVLGLLWLIHVIHGLIDILSLRCH